MLICWNIMTKLKKLIIACDGESASGKSTAANLVSKKYKLLRLNHENGMRSGCFPCDRCGVS